MPDGSAGEILIPAIAPDGRRYPVEKLEAHRLGLLHDAISVFLFCGDEILLQRRAAGKYHCGGLWANACCTHPFLDEAPMDAAARRLREEIGVATPLRGTAVLEYRADVGGGLIEHERVSVFRGEVDRASFAPRLDPREVSELGWRTIDALRAEIADQPERFTPWLKIYVARWPELGLD